MKNIILRTPLELSKRLSKQYNCNVFLKREDLQTVRSFKIRGAYNKIINTKNRSSGFVTASAGNHAQGVAYTCKRLGLESHIFVPENTPLQKISRIEYFGGDNCKLYTHGNTFDECLSESLDFCEEGNKTFVHPFDDPDVIEGQSKIAKEILEEIKPDYIFCTIGGGGLISGTINSLSGIECKIMGVEPEGAASMYESVKQDQVVTLDTIDTFVDGASVKRVGDLTYPIAKKSNSIFKVSNGEICAEMINLYQNEGIIAEPAGALSVCGISKVQKEELKGKNVVCILSGGNNDIMRYPEIVERSLRHLELKHYFIIDFKQKPGELKKYVYDVLIEDTDITRFEYIKKNNRNSGSVLLGIQVSEKHQIHIIKENMLKNNFKFIEITENDILFNYFI